MYTPVSFPSFFCKVDSLILELIWITKVPRLCRQCLQRPKSLGGMPLHNFRFYYWSANIRIFNYWLQLDTLDSPSAWLVIEANSFCSVSLKALLYSSIHCSTSSYTKNMIVKTSPRVWVQFKCYFGLQTFSALVPLAANLVFLPSVTDDAFSVWSRYGIKTFRDLYIDNVFASFQQLSGKFSLPKNHFFFFIYRCVALFITCFPHFLTSQKA